MVSDGRAVLIGCRVTRRASFSPPTCPSPGSEGWGPWRGSAESPPDILKCKTITASMQPMSVPLSTEFPFIPSQVVHTRAPNV